MKDFIIKHESLTTHLCNVMLSLQGHRHCYLNWIFVNCCNNRAAVVSSSAGDHTLSLMIDNTSMVELVRCHPPLCYKARVWWNTHSWRNSIRQSHLEWFLWKMTTIALCCLVIYIWTTSDASLTRINWLLQNFWARNDLGFTDTYFYSKEAGIAQLRWNWINYKGSWRWVDLNII